MVDASEEDGIEARCRDPRCWGFVPSLTIFGASCLSPYVVALGGVLGVALLVEFDDGTGLRLERSRPSRVHAEVDAGC